MPKKNLILALAKVIIAAAWADGEVSNPEINSLKDLLFHVPDLTAADWGSLEIYLVSPVEDAERARLVEELKAALNTPADMRLAQHTLQEIVAADDEVTVAEQAVVAEITNALQDVDTSIFGQIGRLLNGPVQRRSQAFADAPNREIHLETFLNNKIYYTVQHRLAQSNTNIELPEAALRKLSLAGGLMARVAVIDQEVTPGERRAMETSLQKHWNLSPDHAALVVEAAVSEMSKNLDLYRLAREFFSATTELEREQFLETLFAVARGDGQASSLETETIRSIAKLLKMSHKQFIRAKTQNNPVGKNNLDKSILADQKSVPHSH